MFNLSVHHSTTRHDAIQDADEMQEWVLKECALSGQHSPPYLFIELIGKGSFGRVYKARQTDSDKIVAIKVINIDTGDTDPSADIFNDILKEIETLKLLCVRGAKNINTVLHAQLLGHWMWMVTEYCAGGSVSTLMRPWGRLPEQWIIPILREVAEAISWTHKQGVIHRDIKCANVLITAQGGVQLCDFGVAAIITTKFDKRSTFTGSLHWMAPELFNATVQYGAEVDIWAFGSMAYEAATGLPPNADLRNINRLGTHIKQHRPQLCGNEYSLGLKNFINSCLVEDPTKRPAINKIQLHPYIHGSSMQYPTVSLSKLVNAYKIWEAQGGSRLSLFSPGGAQRDPEPQTKIDPVNEWTFSTMKGMNEQPDPDALDFMLKSLGSSIGPIPKSARSNRGRMPPRQNLLAPLEKLFDPNTVTNYQSSSQQFYGHSKFTPIFDLPLRNYSDAVSAREPVVDLDAALGYNATNFLDMSVFDGRKTLEWKFSIAPLNFSPEPSHNDFRTVIPSDTPSINRDSTLSLIDLNASLSPPLDQDSVAKATTSAKNRNSTLSLIDLDAVRDARNTQFTSRLCTANSDAGSSVSEETPFDLEDYSPGSTRLHVYGASVFTGKNNKPKESHDIQPYPYEDDEQRPGLDELMVLQTFFHSRPAPPKMPPAPEPPSLDVLEGRASSENVKQELSRMLSSMKDHLKFSKDSLWDIFQT